MQAGTRMTQLPTPKPECHNRSGSEERKKPALLDRHTRHVTKHQQIRSATNERSFKQTYTTRETVQYTEKLFWDWESL